MAADRPIFRVFIMGRLKDPEPLTLTVLAEYITNRTLERIPLDRSQVDNLTKKIGELRSFIEAGYPPFDEPSLEQLGSDLFNLIIRNDVRRLFDTATGQKKGLLPLQIFSEDYSIAGWPWEYMFDSSNKMFLCQEFHPTSRGLFTRYSGKILTTKERK